MDLDDEVIESIFESPKILGEKSLAGLVAAIRANISFAATAPLVFSQIESANKAWWLDVKKSKEIFSVPPTIAFLAVTVIAAERMGAGQSEPSAYYKHLLDLLEVPAADESLRKKVSKAYTDCIEVLWATLNSWLYLIDGARGYPTAYSLGKKKYVGLPISQALVRGSDRQRIPVMFDFFGLPPGTLLSSEDMETLISRWHAKSNNNLSTSLRALWAQQAAREQISEAFCQELLTWDGSLPKSLKSLHKHENVAKTIAPKIKLTSQVSNRLGKRKLHLGVEVSSLSSTVGESFQLELEPGLSLEFIQVATSRAANSARELLEYKPLIENLLLLSSSDGFHSYRRDPKQLIVMGWDESSQNFREVDQITFGQDCIILVKIENNLAAETASFLSSHARPGFRIYRNSEEMSELPLGWAMFADVQIVTPGASSQRAKFGALIPISQSQVVLAGGLRLPAYRTSSQWLTGYAPELRVFSMNAKTILIRLEYLNTIEPANQSPLFAFSSSNGHIIKNLADLNLGAGDYQIVLVEDEQPTQMKRFSMRDGLLPDIAALHNAPTLGHEPALQGSSFVTSSTLIVEPSKSEMVLGVTSSINNRSEKADSDVFAAKKVVFAQEGLSSSVSKIAIGSQQAMPCVYSGAHYRELENKPNQATVIGTCKHCGIESLEANTPQEAARRTKLRETYELKIASAKVPPVVEQQVWEDVNWTEICRVFTQSLTGTFSSLEKALTIFETSKIDAKELIFAAEEVGVLELTRSANGLPKLWKYTPAQIFQPEEKSNEFFLLGYLTGPQRKRLLQKAKELQIRIQSMATSPIWKIVDSDETKVASLAVYAEIPCVLAAADNLARDLVPLGNLLKNLPNLGLPNPDSISCFDLATGRWIESDAYREGAIRVTSYGRTSYFLVTSESLKEASGKSVSATMSKYLAAQMSGKTILSYDSASRTLYAPIGAKVPGLYGRALAICGGKPSQIAAFKRPDGTKYQMHKYTNVPQAVADQIATLLIN